MPAPTIDTAALDVLDHYHAERQAERETVRVADLAGWSRYDKYRIERLADHVKRPAGQTYVLAMLHDHLGRRVSAGALESRRPRNYLVWRATRRLRDAGLIQAHGYDATDPRSGDRVRLTAYSLTARGLDLIDAAITADNEESR